MRIDYEKVAPGGYKALGSVYGYLLHCGIDPVLFAAVRTVFSEKEVVDLTIAIGLMNTCNRMAIGFRRPIADASAAGARV